MSQRIAVLITVIVMVAGLLGTSTAGASPERVETGSAPGGIFTPAENCGCHSTFIGQWQQSMHAQALTDPLYLTKLAEAQEATDGAIGEFCDKCHGPAATMLGEFGSGQEMSPGAAEGIGCSFCHQVVGLDGEPANTSHLVVADDTRRAQIKDPKAPHAAAYSAFHETAEFCGGCHNVNHPVNGMHLEATYTEWKESPYAEEGIVCQDCHMSAAPGQIGPSTGKAGAGGPERDNIYQMTFVGGQVALGPSEVATARLQSAAEMELEVAEIVGAGEKTPVTVTVINSGAGHYLPTGLTEIRQMWLSVFVEEPGGDKRQIGERRFGTILRDEAGNAPVELWEASEIESDDRIPPKESITETYEFDMGSGVDQATVTAALYYQSATDEFAAKAGVENPTTTMVSAKQQVFSSEEARAASLRETPESPAGTVTGTVWLFIVATAIAVLASGALLLRRRAA